MDAGNHLGHKFADKFINAENVHILFLAIRCDYAQKVLIIHRIILMGQVAFQDLPY